MSQTSGENPTFSQKESVNHALVLAVCGIGMFTDAYDLFIASMAEPFVKQGFQVEGLLLGLMQAAAPLGAALGAFLVGMFADKFGRKSLMYVNMIAFIMVSLLSACAWNPESFMCFRFLVGFWVGADYPICASYLAEIARFKRGKSVAMIRIINAIGYPAGALAAFLIIQVDSSNTAWRWMFLLGAIPAIIGSLLRTKLPESFLWKAAQRIKTTFSGFVKICNPQYRKRTFIASSCYALKDISEYGIHMFMPTILMILQIHQSVDPFEKISNAFKVTIFTSLATLAGCIIARLIINKMDRRTFQSIWFFITAICLLSLGFGIFHPIFTSNTFIVSIFMLYNFFIALVGTTTYLIPAEIYETSIRATGHGFVASMGKIGAFVGTMFLPFLEHSIGIYIAVMIMSLPLFGGALLTLMYPRGIAETNLQ
ncbi:MAG: MFS transporter [Neisseriales bacterium]|nr:MAG: MFS transporter [Neisseriales bacterium]